MTRRARRLSLPSLAFLAALAFAHAVEAAAPRFIMIHGGSLDKPIVLSDHQETMSFIYSIRHGAEASAESLQERPYFEMAFFWGPEWFKYVGQESELIPEKANQHARLYPAFGGAPAVVAFDKEQRTLIPGPRYRGVEMEGIDILRRHKVAVRVIGGARLTGR